MSVPDLAHAAIHRRPVARQLSGVAATANDAPAEADRMPRMTSAELCLLLALSSVEGSAGAPSHVPVRQLVARGYVIRGRGTALSLTLRGVCVLRDLRARLRDDLDLKYQPPD